MKKYSLILILIILLGCNKRFPKTVETIMPDTLEQLKSTVSIVFITGYDKGSNAYYNNAKSYFKAQKTQIVDNLFSIAEIIEYLNKDNTKTYDKIHIVSHSNPWLGMSLTTTEKGERITSETLIKAKEEKEILSLETVITNNTKIIFHSCGLGENKELLQNLKQVFKTKTAEMPIIVASSFFNVFGGKYAGHYLAKPYYGYYPTAESPGPLTLTEEFKSKYPTININWKRALKTRKETALGEVYSYKFNIPVDWEFTFDSPDEIPNLKDRDAIMDWVSESTEMAMTLYNLNIPIEKYRWKSKIKGNKLYIKGKTTVLCVLEPILQENDITEYKNITFDDTSLYEIL